MALLKQDAGFPDAVLRARGSNPAAAAAPASRAGGVIRTARLLLRAPAPADTTVIARLADDRRVAENTARLPHPYTHAHAQEWIALTQTDTAGTDSSFLVTLHDGTVMGACGYGQLLAPVNEIGYWLGLPYWGQGFATEAARALVDHLFENEPDAEIAASARTTNAASRRVIEKCGFAWVGARLMRVRSLATSVPVDRFRMTRADWAARRVPRSCAPRSVSAA